MSFSSWLRSWKSTLARTSPRRSRDRHLSLEALEDRSCPALVVLDFDSPASGSNNTVPINLVSQIPVYLEFTAIDTSFFGFSRAGVHRNTTDPDLLAVSGIGGMALSNGGSNVSEGTGSIELRGALGTSVSFYFGET